MSSAEPQTAADLDYRIARLALAPGDVLVVKIDHTLTADIGGRIREQFERAIGGRNKVLVLDNSIDLSVLTADQMKPQPEIKAM